MVRCVRRVTVRVMLTGKEKGETSSILGIVTSVACHITTSLDLRKGRSEREVKAQKLR